MPRSSLFVLNSLVDGGAERWVAQAAGLLGDAAVVARPDASAVTAVLPDSCRQIDLAMGPKLSRKTVVEFMARAPRHYRYLRHLLRDASTSYGVEQVHFQFKKEQVIGTLAATTLGLDTVWTEHATLPAAVVRSPLRLAYVSAANRTRAIIVPTNRTRESLVDLGVAADKIHVVPNSLPVDWFDAPSNRYRRRVREEFGLHDDDFVVTKVCAVARDRGHDLLLDVAAALGSESKVRILIVGDGPLLDHVRQEVEARGLQEVVRVAGFRRDIKPILDASDAFVNASQAQGEGFPYRVLEAMARGLAVLTTAFPGADEVISSGETGLIVDATARDFIDAINFLRTNRERAATLGRQAREDALDRFSARRTDAMLREIFARPDAA